MNRLALLVVLLLTALPLNADAWARGRGAAYVHLGYTSLDTTRAFDETGERVPFPGRGARRRRASLYAETGLTNALTLVVNAPYEHVTSRGRFNDFTTAGGGDLDLRLRASRRTTRGVFSLEGGAFLPLGYDQNVFPQLGTGTIDPVFNAAYGTSLAVMPEGFLSLQAGYRMRGGGLSDELPYSAKAGAFFHRRIGTFVALRGWESRGDFRDVDPTYALTAADSESMSVAGELYVRATSRFAVNAVWSRAIRGRNAAIGNEWSIGVAFSRP